jgi:hypothetical protein
MECSRCNGKGEYWDTKKSDYVPCNCKEIERRMNMNRIRDGALCPRCSFGNLHLQTGQEDESWLLCDNKHCCAEIEIPDKEDL